MNNNKIGLISNSVKDPNYEITKQVVEFLIQEGFDCYCEKELVKINDSCKLMTEDRLSQLSMILVLGGDGTILNAFTYALKEDIPVLGINLGKIGFLADVEKEHWQQSVLRLKGDDYTIEERMTIEVNTGEGSYHSVNDVIFSKKDLYSIVDFKVYINDVFLAHYYADGLIIAAPTGSTAYNLSAGGPIVNPQCDVMILQPICPHSLNNRAIIISNEEKISIWFDVEKVNTLLDGEKIPVTNEIVQVQKGSKMAKFIRFDEYNFYNLLVNKIKETSYKRGGLS